MTPEESMELVSKSLFIVEKLEEEIKEKITLLNQIQLDLADAKFHRRYYE